MSESEQQENETQSKPEPPTQSAGSSGESDRLPDDHPLVTAFERTKAEAAEVKARLKEIEDRDKTEAQRLADQVTELQQEIETTKAEGLRYQLAVKHGLAEADLELLDTSGDPAEVEKRAKRLAERLGSTPPVASSQHQGRTSEPGAADGDMNNLIRQAAGRQ